MSNTSPQSQEYLYKNNIEACYDFLQHEKQSEIRIVNPNNPKESARSLFVSDKISFLSFCEINNGKGENIYVGINERIDAGTKQKDVVSVQTVVVDIDAIKPKGDASTDEELKKAEVVADKIIEWFKQQGFQAPSKCMSGNGFQLWCAIPKIVIDDLNRESIELQIKAFYKLLISKFSGQGAQIDNIGDLPRIIKVIGTKSVKGEEKENRPHRVSKACGEFKRKEDLKLQKFILGLDAGELEKKVEIPKTKVVDKTRSGQEWGIICSLIEKNLTKEEIFKKMILYAKWSESTGKYREHQYKKALDHVESKKESKKPIMRGEFRLKNYMYFEKLKKDKRFLIDEFLYPNTVNMLYSPPAQFKSIVAMHMAMQIATGKNFMNLKTTKYPILLCDKENNEQIIKNRLHRLRRGHKIRRKNFPLWLLTRNGDILDPIFLEKLEKSIEEKGIKLIIFDTLHRFADYEENKADDINRIYTQVFQPILENNDCAILFLHHTTKEGNYRGSSDLFGMIDTAYSVKRHQKTNRFDLVCEKSRFGEIEKLYGMIDFGEEFIKVMRMNEEEEDKESQTKFMEVVGKIGSIFSIKGDNWKRCDLLSEFEVMVEKGEFEVSSVTVKRALNWMVKKDYLKKLKRGEYTRNWEGEFSLWRKEGN